MSHTVSDEATSLRPLSVKAAIDSTQMSGHGSVATQLCLHKQAAGWIWPSSRGLPISALEPHVVHNQQQGHLLTVSAMQTLGSSGQPDEAESAFLEDPQVIMCVLEFEKQGSGEPDCSP